MPRVKKFTPHTADSLQAGTNVTNRSQDENTDIVQLPGFAADTVSFSRPICAVVFCDGKGNQVIIELSKDGLKQWERQTRK